MDFQLNEDQLQIRDMVHKFTQQEVLPKAAEVDLEARFPRETFEKMAELGLLGLLAPGAYGGVEQSILTFCVVMEEIARGCAATALSYLVHSVLCMHSLTINGSEAQKEKYLPDMVAGKRFASIAMTEPGAGSDVLSMQTTARRCNGDYLLNGSKTFITNAPIADIFLVYARTGSPGDQNGISFFIVERGMPGFSVGQPFHKMGVRGSPTAELFFDNCRVPAENIVRGESQALGILMGGLDVERTTGAAMGVGLARAAFEKAVVYGREREQFGKPIIHFEMIMEKLANMSTEIEAARLLVYKAADLCDKGVRCSAEASQAKLFASEMSVRATSEAMQILGGYGYMQEYEVERMLRDARLGTVGAGTSEIQRLIIAREIIRRNGP